MSHKYDVVIFGSGLAGLVAGLHTQSKQKKTLILERRKEPGGLCGTFMQDGYEFVLGCNDFGLGLVHELKALGVRCDFLHPKARFWFGEKQIQLPPNLSTAATLATKAFALYRVIQSAKKNVNQTMWELLQTIKDPLLQDLACVLIYGMMRSPEDVSVLMMKEVLSKEFAYGYDKSSTPVGGPRVMIDAMLARYKELGGEIWLDCEGQEIHSENGAKRIKTSKGEVEAKKVLSSRGRWHEYPAETKPGLEVAMLLLAIKRDLAYPKGFHTLGYMAPNVAQQLRDLDAGKWNPNPSFHLFCSDLPKKPEHYTVNVVLPMPRGVRELTDAQLHQAKRHILERLDAMIPGCSRSIQYQSFLSPREYEERFQMKSAPSPMVAPVSFEKPSSYDPKQDVHYLGTSVYPPGEHAGAAVLSGKLAAKEALSSV
jgi:phytoene dehydrogenase-like protein